MAFKVVATGWGTRPIETKYEQEALTPLGITVEVVRASSDEEYIAAIKDADAVIAGGRELSAKVMAALEKCKIIANGGVGVDKVDLEAATANNIVVTNVPDVFLDEVANHAMMLILACAKKTVQLDRAVRENRWGDSGKYMSPMPKITDNVLGLVAFGNIPKLVVKRAKGFEMKIIAWDPYASAESFAQAGVERVTDLVDLFKRSDFVSAHLPLNAGTKGILNYSHFSVMKPTAYFINTGRGPTHNEADLIRALNEKKLAGAGLDVMEIEPTLPDNALHAMENVTLTPHTASVSDVGGVLRRQRVGQEIAAVLQGRMPRNVVNKDVLSKVRLSEPVRV